MPKELFAFGNSVPLHLATLLPRHSRFCLGIVNLICQKLNISKTDLKQTTFLTAVSCGIDSVAMLAVFKACQQYFGYTVHAVHFHHGIRKESDRETELFQKICSRLNIPCHIGYGNTPAFSQKQKIGLEEAGRILRYQYFDDILSKLPNALLCTAHHADDLCEDVLMRLIRGTAWPQLGGMAYYDAERKLLRPFLYTGKQELADFAKTLNLPHAEDQSNTDTAFTRNRIRHTLLPLLKQENPQILNSVIKLKQNAEYDQEHFSNEIQKVMRQAAKNGQEISLPVSILQQKDKTIRLHCYHYLLKKLQQGHPNNAIFEKLDNAVMQNKGNTVFKFSDGVRMGIQKNCLVCFIKTNV